MLFIVLRIVHEQVYLACYVMTMPLEFQKVSEKISGYDYHFEVLFDNSGFTTLKDYKINTQKQCNFCETGYNRNSLYVKKSPNS